MSASRLRSALSRSNSCCAAESMLRSARAKYLKQPSLGQLTVERCLNSRISQTLHLHTRHKSPRRATHAYTRLAQASTKLPVAHFVAYIQSMSTWGVFQHVVTVQLLCSLPTFRARQLFVHAKGPPVPLGRSGEPREAATTQHRPADYHTGYSVKSLSIGNRNH